MRGPGRFARPHRAADLPLERVVFQNVTFFRRQPRKPRFQAAEHILVFKTAACRIQRTQQQCQHGALQDVAAAGIIERDAAARKRRLQRRRIGIKVARGDGDLAVAVALLAHEREDLRGSPFALAVGSGCLTERHRARTARHRLRGTEEAAFQMVQRTTRLLRRQRFLPARRSRVARKGVELPAHAQALGKEFAVLRSAKERHGHTVRAAQQDAQYLQLTARKIGKPVKEHILAVNIARGLQIFLQLLQPVACVTPGPIQLGEVHAV